MFLEDIIFALGPRLSVLVIVFLTLTILAIILEVVLGTGKLQ